MRTVMVRYKVRPEAAAENERLIRQVFAQLASEAPAGVRYQSIRLADGVSFVHTASYNGEGPSPLALLPAFKEFLAGIKERCVEQPVTFEAEALGAYSNAI